MFEFNTKFFDHDIFLYDFCLYHSSGIYPLFWLGSDMSNRAVKQAESYFLVNPIPNEHSVKIDGYWFRVTHDNKNKKITNSFITLL